MSTFRVLQASRKNIGTRRVHPIDVRSRKRSCKRVKYGRLFCARLDPETVILRVLDASPRSNTRRSHSHPPPTAIPQPWSARFVCYFMTQVDASSVQEHLRFRQHRLLSPGSLAPGRICFGSGEAGLRRRWSPIEDTCDSPCSQGPPSTPSCWLYPFTMSLLSDRSASLRPTNRRCIE